MNYTKISIERLATGSVIYVRDSFNAAAEVLDIQFEGDSYSVTYGTDDVQFITTVMAGGTVEAFNGQTFLRAEKDISDEEWQAKGDAIDADILQLQGRINAAQGHVCREIDERPLLSAVAAAIGVPALQAAE